MSKLTFTKKVVGTVENNTPPGAMNTFSTVGDVNNDGRIDIVIGGRNGRLVWLENKGEDQPWEEHLIDETDRMECGGSLVDLNGNGRLDVINGGDARAYEIWWWENPGRVGKKWKKRVIATTLQTQFHDTIIGDVKNTGKRMLVFTNQHAPGGTVIYCVPLPDNPTISPWPGLEVVASGMYDPNPYRESGFQPEEGLAIGDVDGDGKLELVCGTRWYKWMGKDQWVSHKFATGYLSTKIAIGDVDGDGRNEIVLSEGDPCVYGKTQGGKVSWFKPGPDITAMWQEHVIEDFLLDAHSLQVYDFTGNGHPDIFVAEVGLQDKMTDNYIKSPPKLLIFENDGKANFTRHLIDEGTGTHEAILADMRNIGVMDIVGKPLHGTEKWNVHVWFNQSK
jgi:hypothetical protein